MWASTELNFDRSELAYKFTTIYLWVSCRNGSHGILWLDSLNQLYTTIFLVGLKFYVRKLTSYRLDSWNTTLILGFLEWQILFRDRS